MLKALGDYVNILVIISIIASLLMTLANKGSTKATIGLVSGLAVVLVLLKPLASIKNLKIDTLISQFKDEIVSAENIYTSKPDNLLKELIADKTSAYILAKAQALNVDCQVNITISDSETPAPESIVITGKTAPSSNIQEELSTFLIFDCGISKENQHFIWG